MKQLLNTLFITTQGAVNAKKIRVPEIMCSRCHGPRSRVISE